LASRAGFEHATRSNLLPTSSVVRVTAVQTLGQPKEIPPLRTGLYYLNASLNEGLGAEISATIPLSKGYSQQPREICLSRKKLTNATDRDKNPPGTKFPTEKCLLFSKYHLPLDSPADSSP